MKITLTGRSSVVNKALWPLTPQIWLAMRMIPFLLTVALLQVNAKGISQKITYAAKNVRLEKIFSVIRKQTGYVFFYHSQDIAEAGRVSVDLKEAPLTTALETSLKDQPLTFSIEGNTIVISAKLPPTANPSPAAAYQALTPPPITIHGRVVNQKGEPFAGLTISVKGGQYMTTTDDNGDFTLTNVEANATLIDRKSVV